MKMHLKTSSVKWRPLSPEGIGEKLVSKDKGEGWENFDDIMQMRRNSSALAVELRIFCNMQSICS